MPGRLGLGLAILALPGVVGACNGVGSPATAAAAPADARCPAPDWGANGWLGTPPVERVWNQLSVDRNGAMYWNGSRIDEETLVQFVDLIPTLSPVPETDLEVDPDAPCETVARIVQLVGGGLDCARLCHYAVSSWRPEGDRGPN